MGRVVVSGGAVVAVVWAEIETNPGYRALAALFDEVAGEHAATFRSPCSFGETERLRSLFDSAGLREVDMNTVDGSPDSVR